MVALSLLLLQPLLWEAWAVRDEILEELAVDGRRGGRPHPHMSLAQSAGKSGQRGGGAAGLELQLSLDESLGFMREDAAAWRRRKRVHLAQRKVEDFGAKRYAASSLSRQSGHTYWQWHYEPSFHCEFEERLGNAGEGGKWVCDPFRITERTAHGQPCLVYSVGSHGMFDFEDAVQKRISRNCEVHVFDPSPPGQPPAVVRNMGPEPSRNVTYHQVCLGPAGTKVLGTACKPLSHLVKELGHKGRRLDLFKIDCEGCEWNTFADWMASGVDIHQILSELHWHARNATKGMSRNQRFFEMLFKKGYVVFHKEANTYGCRGECIEYAFIKLAPSFGRP